MNNKIVCVYICFLINIIMNLFYVWVFYELNEKCLWLAGTNDMIDIFVLGIHIIMENSTCDCIYAFRLQIYYFKLILVNVVLVLTSQMS